MNELHCKGPLTRKRGRGRTQKLYRASIPNAGAMRRLGYVDQGREMTVPVTELERLDEPRARGHVVVD